MRAFMRGLAGALGVTVTVTVTVSCAEGGATDARERAPRANVVKSQLRGYDLGPPFPAGFRDSGLINGYAEGQWIPFVAIMEGKKLADADAAEGGLGDGRYRLGIILPTYSERNDANGISDLQVTGTYGAGAITPIPDPFDDRWLVDHGYSPFVLGAHPAEGAVDLAPEIVGVAQRTGPSRFGGNVSSVSVAVTFALASPTDSVELRFAVRLAPPGLTAITPAAQEFPGLTAGSARGAADFHPGPGPLFVGYEVGEPTGIATVPIRVARQGCVDDDDCVPGDYCSPGGECEQPCVNDSACDPGEICEDGYCQPPPPPCVDDDDCEGDDVCSGGYCLPPCIDTCADPEFCDAEPCYPTPPGGEPPGGEPPGPPCVVDADCPGGEICEDGVCQPPQPPCDVSCPSGEFCEGGVCVPPLVPCADDAQCPGGEACLEGFCRPLEPPSLPPCTTSTDCAGGDGCVGGFCRPLEPPVPCTDDSACDGGTTCEGGFCRPPYPPCGPGGVCPTGELCEGGGGGVCVPEHPPVPCDNVNDCPDGDKCQGGICRPPGQGGDPHPPIPCATPSECPAGDLCLGGFCQPPQSCTGDYDCTGGELCESSTGTCVPGAPPVPCQTASDCPVGGDDVHAPACIGGFCTPNEGACFSDSNCPGGTICDEGLCVGGDPPTACATQLDCNFGETCVGGFCTPGTPVDGCQSSADCPPNVGDDVGPACVNGVCTSSTAFPPACTSDAGCAAGTTCVAGACERVGGACELAGDCADSPLGPSCVGGWCGVACADTGECGAGQTCVLGRCGDVCIGYDECAAGETCLRGGCVPLQSAVSRAGGDAAGWEVEVVEAPAGPVEGGCACEAGGRGSRDLGGGRGVLVALAALAVLVLGARRKTSAAALVATAVLAGTLAACGGGGGGEGGGGDGAGDADGSGDGAGDEGGDGDGTGGDGDASPPGPPLPADAAPGGGMSPFTMVACAAAADAPDAGAAGEDGDAGPAEPPPPESCCDPDGVCGAGAACIVGPGEDHRCRPLCDLAAPDCGAGGVCASFGGQGVCIPAGTEGQPCAPELCDPSTICVGTSADDAVCERKCTSQEDCDEGTTCTPLNGSATMACL